MQHIIETAWENLPNLEITNDLKKAIEEYKETLSELGISPEDLFEDTKN